MASCDIRIFTVTWSPSYFNWSPSSMSTFYS
nr:MAG TPA: hypothetical protein [Caudoviricetes sp.]